MFAIFGTYFLLLCCAGVWVLNAGVKKEMGVSEFGMKKMVFVFLGMFVLLSIIVLLQIRIGTVLFFDGVEATFVYVGVKDMLRVYNPFVKGVANVSDANGSR